jgi:hypothetical protein
VTLNLRCHNVFLQAREDGFAVRNAQPDSSRRDQIAPLNRRDLMLYQFSGFGFLDKFDGPFHAPSLATPQVCMLSAVCL